MDKEIKITPPEGYEVDKENSTFECIKFKPIKQLPKTWEEFCEVYPIQRGETYISDTCILNQMEDVHNRRFLKDRNILPSEEMAKAVLALCQLIQLRDCYNQGWKPDWCRTIFDKWCIEINESLISRETHATCTRVLAFKTEALRDEFLKNFKDLIMIAKPLL